MSSITKCLNTSTICRKVARCDKKLCVVLIEADIFNKAVQGNIPKPLKNLYIKFDVNTLRHCGEMACVEEYLHTFGNSDITNYNSVFNSCSHDTQCGLVSRISPNLLDNTPSPILSMISRTSTTFVEPEMVRALQKMRPGNKTSYHEANLQNRLWQCPPYWI